MTSRTPGKVSIFVVAAVLSIGFIVAIIALT